MTKSSKITPFMPLTASLVSEPLRNHVDPTSPQQVRMPAAKNLVPMRPADMLTVLAVLLFDPDREVSDAARESLFGVPETMALRGLSEALPALVLDVCAKAFSDREEALVTILRNNATDDRTFASVATNGRGRVLEIVADNQKRYLRHTEIIEALYHNPHTPMSTVDRVIETAVRHEVMIDSIPAFEIVAAEIRGDAVPGQENTRFEGMDDEQYLKLLAQFGAFESEKPAPIPAEMENVDEEEPAEVEDEVRFADLTQKLAKLNLSQRIRLAMVGDKNARSLLIRSPQKLVSTAVLRNPRITDMEVLNFAQNRSISEDCVRLISNNRDWTKNYQIAYALTCNPKTPARLAMRFLSSLFERDLRSVAKNRNISVAIQRHAKKTLEMKEKRRG
ncbi:MAG: hypothetical protein KC609_05335 [Myxococcales bacterium]|nr:hypothetical protein [Myxococcales bacterium]